MKRIPYEIADLIEIELAKCTNDYYVKETKKSLDDAVQLKDGRIVLLSKPYLETDFSFSYSLRMGMSSRQWAREQAFKMQTDRNAFIEANTKRASQYLRAIWDKRLYVTYNHHVFPGGTLLRTPTTYRYCDEQQIIDDSEDLAMITEALEAQMERFEKRIQKYLSRYGLTKVHARVSYTD